MGNTDHRGESSGNGLAGRLAAALADGSAESFLIAETEALAGVRSAALLPPGTTADDAPSGAIVVSVGEPPLARLAVTAGLGSDRELHERLEEIAALGAALLANEHLLADSRREARRDPLTGLLNRRSLEERLSGLGDREVALVFCDLDNFKRVNDERGYCAGDDVLREVSRVLAPQLRPGERLYRIGGDEFGVLLEEGDGAAFAVAERLPASLRQRARGPKLPALSTGVAIARAALGADELIARASEALARGRAGRRRQPPIGSLRRPLSILIVDDDPGLRTLLRTTFELADLEVVEAGSAAEARTVLESTRPDAIVLDVRLPGTDGIAFTRELRARPGSPGVLLLTGSDVEQHEARAAGAEALIRKPFSPLELLDKVYRAAGAPTGSRRLAAVRAARADDQLLLYASDLRRLLDVERRQHHALSRAHRETLNALANALESRDTGTAAHSLRVQRYASEIAGAVEPDLLADPSVEYGFLLHDIGKIGIPDQLLRKPGKLTAGERRLMQTHAPIGAGILGEVGLLREHGLAIVRHHHERWDGDGYPDGLKGDAIPIAARVFAVADTLDAITSKRPYRPAQPWQAALDEIRSEAGRQFDPHVVESFLERQDQLLQIHRQLAA